MSLFQLKEKWNTLVGDKEEFDSSSVWVGNIDNSNPPTDKIVIGSFQGFLRIFLPAFRSYKVDDLLLERNLQSAIYQVSAIDSGFPTGTGGEVLHLGVLQARKLSAYLVSEEKTGLNLKTVYEIPLKRNAFNFCIGKFGGNAKDLICIQSVDGYLQFNDSNTVLFGVSLPDFMLPGCICYNSSMDSLVVANGAMELEMHSFGSLGSFANSSPNDHKRLNPEVAVVGETILDLRHLTNLSKPGKGGELLVLTLQHVLVYDDSLFLISQHRLDYTPTCMQVYACFEKRSSQTLMGGAAETLEKWLLLASNTKHLFVYKGVGTVWASQWNNVLIYINTINVGNTKGMIVALSDEGNLAVTYLGTQASSHLVPLAHQKVISYEKIQQDTARLREMIEQKEKDTSQGLVKEGGKGALGVRLQILNCGETTEYVEDVNNVLARGIEGGILEATARLILSIDSKKERLLKNVSINLVPPMGVYLEQTYFSFSSVKAETPLIIPIALRGYNNVFPNGRQIYIYSTYQMVGTNAFRTCCETSTLPLALFLIPISSPKQLKDAPFKITIAVANEAPSLAKLFNELSQYNQVYSDIISSSSGLIAFKYHNGFEVGVLLAKSGGKYRIQAAKFEALWFALRILNDLLKDRTLLHNLR